MEIPNTIINDAIKQSARYKFYNMKKDESEKGIVKNEPEEQHVSPVRSVRGKEYMCIGNQEVNVSSKPKKDVVPKNPRTLTVADNIVEQETVAVKLAKSISIKEQRLQQHIDEDKDDEHDDIKDYDMDISTDYDKRYNDDVGGFGLLVYNKSQELPKFTSFSPVVTCSSMKDLSNLLNDPHAIEAVVQARVLTKLNKQLPTLAPTDFARFVKPRLNKTMLEAQPTEKHLTAIKRIFRYLKDTIHMGLWYPKDTGFKLTAFLDSDHAGCLDSCKITSGGVQFLGGDKLVSWSSKKQDCTSMSSAEAEYVSLSACCAQVLWMRTQLTDYGFHFDKIPMYCDSTAAIAISCNPVQHSRTKHIDIRYHFIKDKVEKAFAYQAHRRQISFHKGKVEKGIVELFFVGTEYQLADLFTKALPEERFKYLVRRLGRRCLTLDELEALANESA
nr:retrovirus-related Pol polyprotein from transposon TNT 1-94 [Tanacetum cinerariifolium]